MAQLLLISEQSDSRDDNREINDIVGVFSDDHVFSEIERQIFTIVSVPLDKAFIESVRPEVNTVVRAKSTDWILENELERKDVWKDKDGALKEIVEKPRFDLRYEEGGQIKENYSRIEANTATALVAAEVKVG